MTTLRMAFPALVWCVLLVGFCACSHSTPGAPVESPGFVFTEEGPADAGAADGSAAAPSEDDLEARLAAAEQRAAEAEAKIEELQAMVDSCAPSAAEAGPVTVTRAKEGGGGVRKQDDRDTGPLSPSTTDGYSEAPEVSTTDATCEAALREAKEDAAKASADAESRKNEAAACRNQMKTSAAELDACTEKIEDLGTRLKECTKGSPQDSAGGGTAPGSGPGPPASGSALGRTVGGVTGKASELRVVAWQGGTSDSSPAVAQRSSAQRIQGDDLMPQQDDEGQFSSPQIGDIRFSFETSTAPGAGTDPVKVLVTLCLESQQRGERCVDLSFWRVFDAGTTDQIYFSKRNEEGLKDLADYALPGDFKSVTISNEGGDYDSSDGVWLLAAFKGEYRLGGEGEWYAFYDNPCVNRLINPNHYVRDNAGKIVGGEGKMSGIAIFTRDDTAVCARFRTANADQAGTDDRVFMRFKKKPAEDESFAQRYAANADPSVPHFEPWGSDQDLLQVICDWRADDVFANDFERGDERAYSAYLIGDLVDATNAVTIAKEPEGAGDAWNPWGDDSAHRWGLKEFEVFLIRPAGDYIAGVSCKHAKKNGSSILWLEGWDRRSFPLSDLPDCIISDGYTRDVQRPLLGDSPGDTMSDW